MKTWKPITQFLFLNFPPYLGGKMNPFLSPYFEKWGSCGTKKFLMASWFLNKYSSRRWKKTKQTPGYQHQPDFRDVHVFFVLRERATFEKKNTQEWCSQVMYPAATKLHPTFESRVVTFSLTIPKNGTFTQLAELLAFVLITSLLVVEHFPYIPVSLRPKKAPLVVTSIIMWGL